jgi:hypothetical protein
VEIHGTTEMREARRGPGGGTWGLWFLPQNAKSDRFDPQNLRKTQKNKIDLEAEEKIDQYQDAMRQAYERFLDKKKFRFSNMFRPKNDDGSL